MKTSMNIAHDEEGALTEWLLRVFALAAYGLGVARLAYGWSLDYSRWTLLLLLFTESYTLLMVLLARRAAFRDLSPAAMTATCYAMLYFVLLQTNGTTALIPELSGVAFQIAGTLWQFASKLALGRSFGLLPAQRGLVTSGPYRLVRHPIYLGYLIGHVGFLLVNFSWFNLSVMLSLYVAQTVRIMREESVLEDEDAYRAYQRSVRWRLVPFVF